MENDFFKFKGTLIDVVTFSTPSIQYWKLYNNLSVETENITKSKSKRWGNKCVWLTYEFRRMYYTLLLKFVNWKRKENNKCILFDSAAKIGVMEKLSLNNEMKQQLVINKCLICLILLKST